MSEDIVLDKKEFVVYEPGVYKARVEKIERTDGKYGTQCKFYFSLLDAEDPTAQVVGWASMVYTEKSKLFRWSKALLGEQFDASDQFHSAWLIGKIALINLELKTTGDGLEVNKISDVMPAREKKLKMQPAPKTNDEIITDIGYAPTAQSVAVVSTTAATVGEPVQAPLSWPEG